jgi:hypothetical protein
LEFSLAILAEIMRFTSPKEMDWVSVKSKGNAKELALGFVMAPRFISKTQIENSKVIIQGWSWQNYTLEKLVRVYFICLISAQDAEDQLTLLFETAEINESVALHAALPALKNPTQYLLRATDAVRSNMGPVFESIAFENPYPSLYFSELAWNQMVLKCIFNDKAIHRIYGLEARANQSLADTLSDFAHERWAAGRRVPSQVWRLVPKFMNEKLRGDIEKLKKSENKRDFLAAQLVIQEITQKGSTKEQWRELELPEPLYQV